MIVAWQWLPFATLILLTALQSLDEEQKEAAEMDGAGPIARFIYIMLPHLSRAITVVDPDPDDLPAVGLRRDPGDHQWRPRQRSRTNLTYLVYAQALLQFDVGGGLGRRHHRRHPRQHRRDLPDAHRSARTWRPDHGSRSSPSPQDRRQRRRMGRGLPDLLPDPVDGAHQLQDRGRGRLRRRRSSSSSTGRLENYVEV